MAPLSVLFVGGTGTISSACAAAVVAAGAELTVLVRGTTTDRPLPAEAEVLLADARDRSAVRSVTGKREFDCVVDFVAYTPEHVEADIETWTGRTGQYVFISSASAYQKPVSRLPILESTPLSNPFWSYSRAKIACEDLLVQRYRDDGFPVTIVRPSHTYDRTSVPLTGGWTDVERMRRHKPVVVHGDGTSLWVLTHHEDFARAFVALLGNRQTLGDVFHITGDQLLTWDQIYRELGRAAGVEPEIVHLASEAIASVAPEWGPSLLGDKAHSVAFDNAKIRSIAPGWEATIPFAAGAREIVEWHDGDPARRAVDPDTDATIERLLVAAGRVVG